MSSWSQILDFVIAVLRPKSRYRKPLKDVVNEFGRPRRSTSTLSCAFSRPTSRVLTKYKDEDE